MRAAQAKRRSPCWPGCSGEPMVSETDFLLHSLLLGVFITFVYDLLRIFRRVVPHARFMVSLEDLGFWVYCGAQVFLLMYRESNGTLRWFAVFGALSGMVSYKKIVSPWLVKYASLGLGKALGFLGKALKWLCRPIGFLCRKAGKNASRAGGRLHRLGKKFGRAVKMRLTFFLKVFKMNLKA